MRQQGRLEVARNALLWRTHAVSQGLRRRWWMHMCRRTGAGVHAEQIPVVINSFNRLTYLKALVEWLERAGQQVIILLDNASTYEPLLDYLHHSPHRVVRLPRNLGGRALWRSPLGAAVSRDFYIYSDPDLIPAPTCPENLVETLIFALRGLPSCGKVGPALRIDNLPACYDKRDEVLRWESQYWRQPVDAGVYRAPIDTTLALYRPGATGGFEVPAMRLGHPYVLEHLPWYEDTAHPTPELAFYASRARTGHWTLGKLVDWVEQGDAS